MASFIVNSGQSSNQMEVQPIIFTQNDVVGIYYPHCDGLIVREIVARIYLKRMLVDNGSSVNIIYRSTFEKMEVGHELTLVTTILYEFTSDNIILRGKITLVTKMGVAPLTTHNFMEFLVVNHHSA